LIFHFLDFFSLLTFSRNISWFIWCPKIFLKKRKGKKKELFKIGENFLFLPLLAGIWFDFGRWGFGLKG